MILRLLITAMMLLAIAKFYLHDNKTDQIKPKQKVDDIQVQLNDISDQAEQQRKNKLKEMGI